jgi:predicted neuraminidase
MRTLIAAYVVTSALSPTAIAGDPVLSKADIFPPEPKHNHASCVVELPGGDLLATWYRGSGERRADDVQIWAARLRKGQTAWSSRFVLADTPGYPDCNPALFLAPDKTLWLLWPTILDHQWEGALLKYAVAVEYPNETAPPKWIRQGVLHITPVNFEKAMTAAIERLKAETPAAKDSKAVIQMADRSTNLLYQRLGWMPRVHPTVLPSGRWLWPLYCDTFSISIIAISDDRGATWSTSQPMIGFGNIQPSLVRKNDGTIVAFMRDNGPHKKIRVSTSADEGKTWSEVVDSQFPNPGAGVEAIRLANGHWALIYNDLARGRHSLAMSISDDEGRSWKWTRHLERAEPDGGSFHYPSILQSADGSLVATYTWGGTKAGSTIRAAKFNEEWVLHGD